MKQTIRNILKVLTVGVAAAGLSSAAIFLACMSVYIFITIPAVCGYVAVALFLLAMLAAAASIAIVYVCGCWIVRKGKYAK